MKKYISAAANILSGLFIAVSPWTICEICSRDEKIMKCYYSCKAEIAIGAIAVIIGLITLFLSKNVKHIYINLISIAVSAAAISIPLFIIGGCKDDAMRCQSITFPCIYLISTINIIVQLIIAIKTIKDKN